jgi:iron complex outermembrane receptor protein
MAVPARAQTASTSSVNLDLGSVLSSGYTGGAADYSADPTSAPYVAPSKAPLTATQPTSVISKQSIQNNFSPTAGYSDIVSITPSVMATNPNGPGSTETRTLSIRGFTNGQYNTTFDGVPWADSNSFTQHSTSYLMSNDIGQMIVDRGPGGADTVGYATFGGTISIRSKDPLPVTTFTPYGTVGSYGTYLAGLEADTGAIQQDNGASGFVDAETFKTNGYLTNSKQLRNNFFGKFVQPIGTNTVLTLTALYNRIYQDVPLGATKAQIAQHGSNWGLSNDPNTQDYWEYNTDHINTDSEQADLTSRLGNGLTYDGKLYSYAYYHYGDNGTNVGLTTGNVTSNGETYVPGQTMDMKYRGIGTMQRFVKDIPFGDVKMGIWYEYQYNSRQQLEVDWSDGGTVVTNAKGSNNGIDRLMHDTMNTFQPYLELELKPIPGLTLTPGVKYVSFTRGLNAPVNQGTEQPLGYEHTYSSVLPSFEARYAFTPNLSTYAQVAKGFLAPNLGYLQTTQPNSELNPEVTWNYQAGMAYQSQRLALGTDVYLVHFLNYVNSQTQGTTVYYYNQGGVVYRGIEGEATYNLGQGFSIFGNGSLNYAQTTSTHTPMADTPQFTANSGLIYSRNNVYASVIDQWTGGHYDNDGYTNSGKVTTNVPGGWYDPYNIVNLNVGYTVHNLTAPLKVMKVQLNIDNLTNATQIYDSTSTTSGTHTPLYWTIPGRSVYFSLSVPITG